MDAKPTTKDFHDRVITIVQDQTVKPTLTEYSMLLPTLLTWSGMVLGNGDPADRRLSHGKRSALLTGDVCRLFELTHTKMGEANTSWQAQTPRYRSNIEACVVSVTKRDLLAYIQHGKRIDIEQAVAMVVAYFWRLQAGEAHEKEDFEIIEADDAQDDFEGQTASVIEELMNDESVKNMLDKSCMWREDKDNDLLSDARDTATKTTWSKIMAIIQSAEPSQPALSTEDIIDTLIPYIQRVRRKRSKLSNSQHLTIPDDILPSDLPQRREWSWKNHIKYGIQHDATPNASPILLSKNRFRIVQRLLGRLGGPTDITSRYVFDVETFKKSSSNFSLSQLKALEKSDDPYAIAYSFLSAQRHRQLKVVSDPRWTRFLINGEGALILQNRPDVLTSVEDILIRRATDLVALTAVSCPKGIRDHFSSKDELLKRTRTVCEFMERYVRDFGLGSMSNLVYNQRVRDGSGRGPVDVYNSLCDELRDCKARAKAMGIELHIRPVYKFLAKDIMAWNNAWKDDAFADMKIPGWVEYLARVRLEELQV